MEALAATGGEKPAAEQYESDYFGAKLELTQFDTDEVYLLTPENGFVELDETVPPDTFTFHECEIGEQAR